MDDFISFTAAGSRALTKLPLGDTLIRFTESDFTEFWEQCIDVAHKYRATGEFSPERTLSLGEYVLSCHPYCRTAPDAGFGLIAVDCIIDYLCMTDGVGLEELWVKYLSPADVFQHMVWSRISEYKSGRAINQWANLLRMQSYAAAKLSFVYGGEYEGAEAYDVRRTYFDSAFRLSARAMGCDGSAMPHVSRSSIPMLADGPEILKNSSTLLEPVIKAMTVGRHAPVMPKGSSVLEDQNAGMAINAMLQLPRPTMPELRQFQRWTRSYQGEVYEPSSFKAIIDLEFDKLAERGLCLVRDSAAGSYAVRPIDGASSAVGSAPAEDDGFEIFAEAQEAPKAPAKAQHSKPQPEEKPAEAAKKPKRKKSAKAEDEPAEAAVEAAPAEHEKPAEPVQVPEGTDRAEYVRQLSQEPGRVASGRSLQDVNTRCQLICSGMHVRIGWNVTTEEIRQWFRHLIYIRRCIGTGEMTAEDLEKYLDATEEVYGPPPGGAE